MNKLLTSLVTAALGLGLGLSLPAYAAHDDMGEHCNMHTKKTFEEADADKDGSLDKKEARSICKKNFAKMDTDKNGTISKEELNACGNDMHDHNMHDKKSDAKHEKHSKEFAAADTDNDGTLTKEEVVKLPRVAKNFDAIDTDKDGTLDRNEVHEFMHSHKPK